MVPRGGRSGPGWLDGEVAEGAAADCMAGRRGGSGRRRGRVPARGRAKGAGQVALEGSLGSTWPRTRRGLGPPAAYGRAAANQRGERETGTRLQISKVQGPSGKLKLSPS